MKKTYTYDKKISASGLIFGLLAIAAAVVLILDSMGLMPELFSVFGLWHIVGSVFMAAFIVESLRKRDYWAVGIWAATLYAIVKDPISELLSDKVKLPGIGVVYLAALLLGIGLSLILPKRRTVHVSWNVGGEDDEDLIIEGKNGEKEEYTKGVGEKVKNTFGSYTTYVDCNTFTDIFVSNTFGETKVFFENGEGFCGNGLVELQNAFGETILYIPKDWKVERRCSATFGEVYISSPYEKTSDKTLILSGSCAFGEVRVVRR